MVGLADCPHCHARIIPGAHGECPACHRFPGEPGAMPHLRRMRVRQGGRYPKLCCTCGVETKRTGWLRDIDRSSAPSPWLFLRALYSFSARIRLLTEIDRPVRGVAIPLPRCAECEAMGPLEGQNFDFETGAADLLVHVRFAEGAAVFT